MMYVFNDYHIVIILNTVVNKYEKYEYLPLSFVSFGWSSEY